MKKIIIGNIGNSKFYIAKFNEQYVFWIGDDENDTNDGCSICGTLDDIMEEVKRFVQD